MQWLTPGTHQHKSISPPELIVTQHLVVSLQLLSLPVLSMKPEAKDAHISPSLIIVIYHPKQSQGVVKLGWEEEHLRMAFHSLYKPF